MDLRPVFEFLFKEIILSLKTQIPREAGFDGISLQSPKLRVESDLDLIQE